MEPSDSIIASDNADENKNDITGSSLHYALYDWFHEGNCTSPEEHLRKSSLVKETAGRVDTQALEQLFSSTKRDLYFLNNMSPANHVFMTRLLFDLRIKKANKDVYLKQQIAFDHHICLNQFGRVFSRLIYLTKDIEGTYSIYRNLPIIMKKRVSNDEISKLLFRHDESDMSGKEGDSDVSNSGTNTASTDIETNQYEGLGPYIDISNMYTNLTTDAEGYEIPFQMMS